MDSVRSFFERYFWKKNPEIKENNAKFNEQPNFENNQIDVLPHWHGFYFKNSKNTTTVEKDFEDFGIIDSLDTPGNEFDPSQHIQRPSFIFGQFGDILSIFGQMIRDVNMLDMNQIFEGSEIFNHSGFDNMTPRHLSPALEDNDNNDDAIPKGKDSHDLNLRDKILKSDSPSCKKENPQDRIDTVLDDLYKEKKLDLNEIFSDENKPQQVVPAPRRNQCQRTRTSSQSSYSYVNGKWVLKETIVKETNEGKEVTSRITNEKGEVECNTEYIPYDRSSNTKLVDKENHEFAKLDNLFEKFFRPRM